MYWLKHILFCYIFTVAPTFYGAPEYSGLTPLLWVASSASGATTAVAKFSLEYAIPFARLLPSLPVPGLPAAPYVPTPTLRLPPRPRSPRAIPPTARDPGQRFPRDSPTLSTSTLGGFRREDRVNVPPPAGNDGEERRLKLDPIVSKSSSVGHPRLTNSAQLPAVVPPFAQDPRPVQLRSEEKDLQERGPAAPPTTVAATVTAAAKRSPDTVSSVRSEDSTAAAASSAASEYCTEPALTSSAPASSTPSVPNAASPARQHFWFYLAFGLCIPVAALVKHLRLLRRLSVARAAAVRQELRALHEALGVANEALLTKESEYRITLEAQNEGAKEEKERLEALFERASKQLVQERGRVRVMAEKAAVRRDDEVEALNQALGVARQALLTNDSDYRSLERTLETQKQLAAEEKERLDALLERAGKELNQARGRADTAREAERVVARERRALQGDLEEVRARAEAERVATMSAIDTAEKTLQAQWARAAERLEKERDHAVGRLATAEAVQAQADAQHAAALEKLQAQLEGATRELEAQRTNTTAEGARTRADAERAAAASDRAHNQLRAENRTLKLQLEDVQKRLGRTERRATVAAEEGACAASNAAARHQQVVDGMKADHRELVAEVLRLRSKLEDDNIERRCQPDAIEPIVIIPCPPSVLAFMPCPPPDATPSSSSPMAAAPQPPSTRPTQPPFLTAAGAASAFLSSARPTTPPPPSPELSPSTPLPAVASVFSLSELSSPRAPDNNAVPRFLAVPATEMTDAKRARKEKAKRESARWAATAAERQQVQWWAGLNETLLHSAFPPAGAAAPSADVSGVSSAVVIPAEREEGCARVEREREAAGARQAEAGARVPTRSQLDARVGGQVRRYGTPGARHPHEESIARRIVGEKALVERSQLGGDFY
ncbi:hypothetical protein B0H17DRAFT_1128089 [Mycena rosella]|uniref:Proteophosphoglycan ppg4 n=1 Tax=Mycena rosella TaxID=1033263 RepID=A0AAD7DY82_MYCRO|nr:hypothetical protein B0H17DRAFT_1128089 [Mycena rosella]